MLNYLLGAITGAPIGALIMAIIASGRSGDVLTTPETTAMRQRLNDARATAQDMQARRESAPEAWADVT